MPERGRYAPCFRDCRAQFSVNLDSSAVTSDFKSQLKIEMEAGGKQEETAPVSLMLPSETRPGVLDNDTSRDEHARVEAFHG